MKTWSNILLAVTVGLTAPLGCGSDSDESNSTPKEEIISLCNSFVEHGQSCNWPMESTQAVQKECEDFFLCEPVTKTKLIANLISCETNMACDMNGGDECLDNEINKYKNDPTLLAFTDACQSKAVEECGLDNDICSSVIGLNEETLNAFSTCLNEPCDSIASCFNDAVDSIAPGCDDVKFE